MAKAAVLEDDITTEEATPKQLINEGIDRFIAETGIDGQKARYKAQRAIAFQAFLESLEGDDFDDLVTRAIAGADELPAGWGLERSVAAAKEAPAKAKRPAAKKTATKAPAKKTAAKAPAKAAGRRRPARKSAE